MLHTKDNLADEPSGKTDEDTAAEIAAISKNNAYNATANAW